MELIFVLGISYSWQVENMALFYIKLFSETIAAMNDIVKAPFPILFFALCEVGKPWPIILSYLFPSPSYMWGFDQYHNINPKEGRNN